MVQARAVMAASIALAMCAALCPTARADSSRDQVAAALAKTETAISDIDGAVLKLTSQAATQQNTITTLETQEEHLKNKLSLDLRSFYVALANLARVQRQPVAAMLAYDAFSLHPGRAHVLSMTRKAVQEQMSQSRASLYDLLANLQQAQAVQNKLDATREGLLHKRQMLADLRAQQVKLLTLAPSDRKKLLKAEGALGQGAGIDDVLKLKTRLSGLVAKSDLVSYPDLPVDGRIITHFGQTDRETGLHSIGIRIAAIPGAAVHAVRGGRVIYSGPFKGYGYLVILEHENGVHSLYSGFAGDGAQVGDYVPAGGILGYLPKTDTCNLYMELRKGGDPINPEKWLPVRQSALQPKKQKG